MTQLQQPDMPPGFVQEVRRLHREHGYTNEFAEAFGRLTRDTFLPGWEYAEFAFRTVARMVGTDELSVSATAELFVLNHGLLAVTISERGGRRSDTEDVLEACQMLRRYQQEVLLRDY